MCWSNVCSIDFYSCVTNFHELHCFTPSNEINLTWWICENFPLRLHQPHSLGYLSLWAIFAPYKDRTNNCLRVVQLTSTHKCESYLTTYKRSRSLQVAHALRGRLIRHKGPDQKRLLLTLYEFDKEYYVHDAQSSIISWKIDNWTLAPSTRFSHWRFERIRPLYLVRRPDLWCVFRLSRNGNIKFNTDI